MAPPLPLSYGPYHAVTTTMLGLKPLGRLALDESRPVTSETTRFQCTPADQVLKAASEMAQRACAA